MKVYFTCSFVRLTWSILADIWYISILLESYEPTVNSGLILDELFNKSISMSSRLSKEFDVLAFVVAAVAAVAFVDDEEAVCFDDEVEAVCIGDEVEAVGLDAGAASRNSIPSCYILKYLF